MEWMSPRSARSRPPHGGGQSSLPRDKSLGRRKRALSGRARLGLLLALALVASLLFVGQARSLGPGTTFLVSQSSEGVQANRLSEQPAITASGRWVAFTSEASTLVPGDTNGSEDVFVRDTEQNVTVRLSLSNVGEQGNDDSFQPSISSDGRFVAFASAATNFIPGCSEFCGGPYVYVRDRDLDGNGVFDQEMVDEEPGVATVMISVDDDGELGFGANNDPAISGEGRYVAFVSNSSGGDLDPDNSNDNFDVFVRDRDTDSDGIYDEPGLVDTQLVSRSAAGEGNFDSVDPAISSNGQVVTFTSDATDLGPPDSNGVSDIYARELGTNTTSRVSISTSEAEANGASVQSTVDATGRWIAFASDATNLLLPDPDTNNFCDIDEDGVFDENCRDVFIRDRTDGTTILASVNSKGVQGNGRSIDPDITADGRYVAFASLASNLRRGDTNRARDVFVRDQFLELDGDPEPEGRTNRVSISAEGDETPPRSVSQTPAASDDGRFVAFVSDAPNLVGRDENEDGICDPDSGCDRNRQPDVFVRDRQPTVQIDPIPVLFDTRLVTDPSPPRLVQVSNEGDGPMTIGSVQVLGPGNPGDFTIATDGCTGRRLHPEEGCFVGIQFRPTRPGTRSAFFAVSKLGSEVPDATALMLGGGFQPLVAISPNIGPPGFVASVEGILFPPQKTIVLKWKPGLGRVELRSDSGGDIAGQILIFHNDITGPRLLRAKGPGVRADAEFMVTVATGQPPKFVNR
jgi:Tol biopolymer transport system component